MTYKGTVQSGVVVFPDGAAPPEGTVVTVIPSTSKSQAATGDRRSIWQKLADLGRQVESEPCDLPTDLAANHDYYLHGLPKRQ